MGSSRSNSSDTPRTQAQAEILKARAELFNKYFKPILVEDLAGTDKSNSRIADIAVGNVNKSFSTAEQKLQNRFRQRKLTGGFAAQGESGLAAARAAAVGDAANKAFQLNLNRRLSLLQLGLGQSPTPTTAATTSQSSHEFHLL